MSLLLHIHEVICQTTVKPFFAEFGYDQQSGDVGSMPVPNRSCPGGGILGPNDNTFP